MPKSRRKGYGLPLLLACTSVVALFAMQFAGSAQRKPLTAKVLRQQDRMQAGKQPTDKELDDAAAPIVDLTQLPNTPADEKRKQKNKRFDNALPESIETNPTSEETNIASEGLVSDMPTDLSDLIVEGQVKESAAFLSEDKTGIYSEFTVQVSDVIKSSSPVNKGDLITTERFGGRVRFPSGQIARYRVAGQGAPAKGGKYLFFLKRMADGDYRILTAYEMRGNKVLALDGPRSNVNGKGSSQFDKHNGKDAQEFRKEVSAAAQGGAQ
jgi:hypothetical protein